MASYIHVLPNAGMCSASCNCSLTLVRMKNILYDAHPHIGTNKLPQIITAMREQIIACGGEVLFDKKLTI